MTDPVAAHASPQEAALQREVVRLNKIVTALMNRAERDMSAKVSDFSAFQSGVALENQVRERTQQ
ncbi:MAG: histidine kinase, partial [Dechloromonas sp.]|nr:histidine kinase [Dechloromonas sp.]